MWRLDKTSQYVASLITIDKTGGNIRIYTYMYIYICILYKWCISGGVQFLRNGVPKNLSSENELQIWVGISIQFPERSKN